MSHENLINLSLDENMSIKRQESLEYSNNPFDLLQKEADIELDPFEMCMKQVMNSTPSNNVQTCKLLCFSEEKSSESLLIPFTNVNKMETFGSIAASSSACETPTNTSNTKKKPVDHRKLLLKLSLTNSVTSSPIVGTPPSEGDMFSNAFESMGYHRSPRSSPLEDSFLDINSIKPDWLEAENSLDADLEELCIPALKGIPSPLAEEPQNDSLKEKFEKFRDRMNSSEKTVTPKKDDNKKQSPVLELLRERVKQCKEHEERVKLCKEQEEREKSKEQSPESNKSSSFDVSSLISSLKNIALECSTEQKRNIVDSLTSIFKEKEEPQEETSQYLAPPPQPIVRQGTFDVELDESREKSKAGDEEVLNQSPPPPQEEQEYKSIDECKTPEDGNNGLNDIMEQIGKLLGNQNVNVVQANIQTPCQGNQQSNNPTYIVVMNTPLPHTPSRLQRSIVSVSNFNDGSPELNQSVESQIRRRTQSLSVHDKKFLDDKNSKSPSKMYCATPQRLPGFRRNSISSPSVTPLRRPISYPGNKDPSLTKTLVKKPSFDEPTQTSKPVANIRPELNVRKLKLKATSDVGAKSTGPLKATIPVKKVAPMIVHPQEGERQAMTSTSRENNGAKPKSRYSYMPTTPSANKNTLSPGGATRRRTLSEKSSPKKSDGGVSKPTIRSLKMPSSITKTLNKLTVSKAGGVRPKNKENKNPGL